jgi:SAM-dependent methyltransferase
MRRFSAEYLADTRRGMWESREALAPCSLADRRLAVDVGCGTGAFAAVLAEETPGRVVGVDRDPALLAELPPAVEPVRGDANSLPLRPGGPDLIACQALLVNLPEPEQAVAAFAGASGDLVAAVEPDNAAVGVESTVAAEERLAARARERFVAGVETDLTLGTVPELLRRAGLVDVRTRWYEHEQVVEPPYEERDVVSARRKASGEKLAARRTELLAGGLSPEAYERLRMEWREMGRAVVRAMHDGDYRRREVVPFGVTVGRVPRDGE